MGITTYCNFFIFQNQPNTLIQSVLKAFTRKAYFNQTASCPLGHLNQNVTSDTGIKAIAPGASILTVCAPSFAGYKASAYEQILSLSEDALRNKGYAKVNAGCWKYTGTRKNARKWIYTYADPDLISLIYQCPDKLHFPPNRPLSEAEVLAYLLYKRDMHRCREELNKYLR